MTHKGKGYSEAYAAYARGELTDAEFDQCIEVMDTAYDAEAQKALSHEPAVTVRDTTASQYSGHAWRGKFICPQCHRVWWRALNFLGKRTVVCHGTKSTNAIVAD